MRKSPTSGFLMSSSEAMVTCVACHTKMFGQGSGRRWRARIRAHELFRQSEPTNFSWRLAVGALGARIRALALFWRLAVGARIRPWGLSGGWQSGRFSGGWQSGCDPGGWRSERQSELTNFSRAGESRFCWGMVCQTVIMNYQYLCT